ncbi:MAG: hypothetical protein O2984_00085 [Bacteroidetes bacterium]|nr:hypothetical protein [Bacteroidota bacterium]
MKQFYILSLIIFSTLFFNWTEINAQTLSAGDIAFLGYNTDGASPIRNDDFTFITLKDIPAGEIIYFTEEGWTNQTNNWVGTTEAHLTWTSPVGGVLCGAVIHVNEPNNDNNMVVTGGGTAVLSTGSGWNLSAGDQVLAYYSASGPEPASTPTFIAGIHGDDGNGIPFTLNTLTGWNDLSLTTAGMALSELPPGLTNGVNCISLFPAIGTETDNARYNGTLIGTSTVLRGLINDRTNWVSDNITPYNISPVTYSPSVACLPSCTDPDIPTATSAPGTICAGNAALLTISGDKNDATAWHVYTGSCGGTLVGTTTGTTIIVVPTPPSTEYFIRGEGGCVTPGSCGSITVTTTPREDASFSYDAAAYCVDDSDPTPTVTGVGGGTFSVGTGLSINTSTGAIDVSTSTPGTYTVTYSTAGTCPNSSSDTVTINALDDPSFSYDAAAYCADDSDPTPTITGLAGGTFSSGAGLTINASTGALDVSISTPGTYTVTYTTSGTCPNSSSVTVTINSLDDASFNYSAASYCVNDTDPTPTITGLAGGSFSSTAGLSLNTGTGAIDVSLSTPGTYTVTYTTAGSCPNSSNVNVTINEICDGQELAGCLDPNAINYEANATDPGNCTYANVVLGCTYQGASNYNASATIDNGTCEFLSTCPGDFNDDGAINAGDLLVFLSYFGSACQ